MSPKRRGARPPSPEPDGGGNEDAAPVAGEPRGPPPRKARRRRHRAPPPTSSAPLDPADPAAPSLAALRLRHLEAADLATLLEVEAGLRRIIAAAVATGPSTGDGDADDGDVGVVGRQRLALLLVQRGDAAAAAEARPLLRRLGCRYRLADEVLRYDRDAEGPPGPDTRGCVAALDGALPPDMLTLMQAAFAPNAAFWRENAYDCETGDYFSFVHALAGAPTTALDQVLRHLHRTAAAGDFPEAAEAQYVEWWAHCRPHPSGHQLHFDSADEGRGGVRNPIVSSVLYLSGATVGGPTLVTGQQVTDPTVAKDGWLVFPRENRFCMFSGRLLHGVIPGRGVPDGSPAPEDGDPAPRRRVTFMAAFWKDLMSVRPHPTAGVPGAAEPFPNPTTSALAWPRRFLPLLPADPPPTATASSGTAAATAAPVVRVSRVWEDVDPEDNARRGCVLQSLAGLPPYDACFQGF